LRRRERRGTAARRLLHDRAVVAVGLLRETARWPHSPRGGRRDPPRDGPARAPRKPRRRRGPPPPRAPPARPGGRARPGPPRSAPGLAERAGLAPAAFRAVASRGAEPVLPLRLFANRAFAVASAVGFIVGFALFGSVTYLPIFLQTVKGSSPTASGLQMLPM